MAVGDAYVFPGFLTPVLTLLFFQSHRLLFSHASAEVRGENTPERKVASTWDQTHNHQVMSPTRSPLSHPGGFKFDENGRKLSKQVENTVGKGEIARYEQFLLFPQCFQKACFPGVIVWEWVNLQPCGLIPGSANIRFKNW